MRRQIGSVTSENHQVTAENRQLMAAKKIGETTNQQLQAEVSWQALERAPHRPLNVKQRIVHRILHALGVKAW